MHISEIMTVFLYRMTDESICGFVQNVSPVRVGPKKKFFDFQFQTESEKCVRGVCFSPPKRKLFEQYEKNSTPVKIRKFVNDTKEGSNDILLGEYAMVDELEAKDVAFTKKKLVPTDVNLSMLGSMCVQQLVNIKAKLVYLAEIETINTPHSTLRKCDAILVDPKGSIKITLWEDDIQKVKMV